MIWAGLSPDSGLWTRARLHAETCSLFLICVLLRLFYRQHTKCRGRQWRARQRTNCCTNVSLGDKVSEVPGRSKDTCASLPSSLLRFPIPPHLADFSSFLFFLFSPRSECNTVALLTLIPRSSLLKCPSDGVCVHVCLGCEEADFPTAIWGEWDMHTHSAKLIDE